MSTPGATMSKQADIFNPPKKPTEAGLKAAAEDLFNVVVRVLEIIDVSHPNGYVTDLCRARCAICGGYHLGVWLVYDEMVCTDCFDWVKGFV
jgi:hypothetical protein